MNNKVVTRAADNLRVLEVAMVERANSGHPGGAMGASDFINILYSEFLHFDPDDLTWENRDRFFLDPGHMSPMLYSVLALAGSYTMDDLKNFRQWQSNTPGHPELNVAKGIENTSGPLGQGHTNAIGAAIAEKFLRARFGEWMKHTIYTFVSDGGVQEEISQGAGRLAGYLGLDNLVMFYDANKVQLSTKTSAVTNEDTAKKYEAWGWRVKRIKGDDPEQIRLALNEARDEQEKPFLIIGETVMGKGCITEDGERFEGEVSTHGMPISGAGASAYKTMEKLGGDPENPFAIFDDVKAYWQEILDKKRNYAAEKRKEQERWEQDNPELARKWHKFMGDAPLDIDFSTIPVSDDNHTRGASGEVLAYFANHVENMIVASADLANSDKTIGFLKNTKPITKGDFTGAFIHAGVSELTLAAVGSGMALHKGVYPVCGTFFAFSDYMKPAVRMAALMELPVKYVWTHDSFRVGEDGPTHQPVEQEAQIRLLEKLRNHSGNPGMRVLRPADAPETVTAWEMAMKNTKSPTGLILSRQKVKNLPDSPSVPRKEAAMEAKKGGYIVKNAGNNPDIVLVGNGSEVATLIEAAETLENDKKLAVQVSSVISEQLFREQDESYRQKVVPDGVPVFGLTAGLPEALTNLVGPAGRVKGLEHFGYSANYKVLDEQFGFTGPKVARDIWDYYQEYRQQ